MGVFTMETNGMQEIEETKTIRQKIHRVMQAYE